jgi:hypothetical protein
MSSDRERIAAEIWELYEVAAERRCPTCGGKPASYRYQTGYLCGCGFRWKPSNRTRGDVLGRALAAFVTAGEVSA